MAWGGKLPILATCGQRANEPMPTRSPESGTAKVVDSDWQPQKEECPSLVTDGVMTMLCRRMKPAKALLDMLAVLGSTVMCVVANGRITPVLYVQRSTVRRGQSLKQLRAADTIDGPRVTSVSESQLPNAKGPIISSDGRCGIFLSK
mmetsp:Transcript_54495/g.63703  ORF Transcript_54495/g.63703 Transcript_54495/m.63703 type:complete len:147 (+) Transcript_54495:278-718(+)